MSTFNEKLQTLKYKITHPDAEIRLRCDAEYGTIASTSYENSNEIFVILHEGEEKALGKGTELLEQTMHFDGHLTNPESNHFKVIYTLVEKLNSSILKEEVIYVFPDNYEGDPAYDSNDSSPTFYFPVTFKPA